LLKLEKPSWIKGRNSFVKERKQMPLKSEKIRRQGLEKRSKYKRKILRYWPLLELISGIGNLRMASECSWSKQLI
jgi:hypothetical protein